MANPWFRLYAEFATDPKVQMLNETDQRRFIMLLCLRCSNGNETLQDETVTFQLRISNEEWAATKQVLLSKCLIDADNSPTAWDKRQFVSDSSAARVSRHREKKKRECNVTETPPDTDTDTEVNIKSSCASQAKRDDLLRGFAEFWLAYPKRKNKGDAEKAWQALKPNADLLKTILEAVEVARDCDDWRKESGKYVPYPASWLRAKGWEDETPGRVGAVKEPYTYPLDLNREELPPGWLPPPNGCTRYFPELGWLL
jgi:hypothetical protein